MQTVDTIIFDIGNVLVDYNPRYLYRKIFKTEDEVEWFLANVTTHEWNEKQDAGRSFEVAIKELHDNFPDHTHAINAWSERWQETISGPIQETVDILKSIKDSKKYRLYALTNWSAETFPWALETFPFLHLFEGIVVSGVEKTRKPFPEFYHILLNRYSIKPERCIFIDDNPDNIKGAKAVGIDAIACVGADDLKVQLEKRGISI